MRRLKAFQGLRLGSASIRSLDAPLPSVQAVPLSLSVVVVLAVVVLPLRSPPFRTKAFTTTRKPCTHACTMAGSPTIPLGPASMAGNCRPVALQQVWAGGGRYWRAAPEYFASPLHLVAL